MTDPDARPFIVDTVRFAPDVVVRRVGEEALALKLSAEAVFSLNATAARVATLIEAGVSLPGIVEQLAAEYEQPRDIVTVQIQQLVADFTAKGLIVGTGQDVDV